MLGVAKLKSLTLIAAQADDRGYSIAGVQIQLTQQVFCVVVAGLEAEHVTDMTVCIDQAGDNGFASHGHHIGVVRDVDIV